MSMSVDVLMFDWQTLVDKIVEHGCNDRQVVEEVLNLFGEKICDKYVILSNDHYEEDQTLLLCIAIEDVFDVGDVYDLIFDLDFDYIGGGESDNMWRKDNKVRALAIQVAARKLAGSEDCT